MHPAARIGHINIEASSRRRDDRGPYPDDRESHPVQKDFRHITGKETKRKCHPLDKHQGHTEQKIGTGKNQAPGYRQSPDAQENPPQQRNERNKDQTGLLDFHARPIEQ